jgi:enoyl-CoA hydratase/carnithine racemase
MDFIRRERHGKIIEIVIDRPKANAINAELSTELGRTFAEFRDDDSLLVAIITGAGEKFFSAGWDLKSGAQSDELPDQSPGKPFGVGGFAGITELPNRLQAGHRCCQRPGDRRRLRDCTRLRSCLCSRSCGLRGTGGQGRRDG